METIKVKVLEVKHINQFFVRHSDSIESQRYSKLEKVIQISYGNKSVEICNEFRVGSYVAALVSLNGERGPKLWLRGVVRENYHQKDFLYGVYFGDYGFDKTCHKSDLRELSPYHSPQYVPFQTFNVFLTDIDYKSDVKREDVIREIDNQLETNKSVVSVIIEGRDREGSIYGSILIEDDCDLAAILLEKQLVNDVHYCGRKKNEEKACAVTVGPLLPGPFRSGNKWSQANSHCPELICKCDSVLKYKRKLLRDKIKTTAKNTKKSSNQRFNNSL